MTTTPTPTPTAGRLLVVEDDHAIADAIARRLVSAGYQVDTVHDGPAAVRACEETRYGAVVLDVSLPGFDGLEVCRRVQAREPIPVIMVTARDEEADRLVGLGVGADDYLVKPFSPRELVARVAALLRRVERAEAMALAARDTPITRVGAIEIDARTRRVRVDDVEVHLTRTEFDLLAALARSPGDVVQRDRLLVDVWQWPTTAATVSSGSRRTVDSHVRALRRKVGAHRIRTVSGVGYALEAGQ